MQEEEYILSRAFLSADAEPVRSICFLDSPCVKKSTADSMDVDADEEKSNSEVLLMGSQAGLITQCTYNPSKSSTNVDNESMESFQSGHSHAITSLLPVDNRSIFVSGCKDSIVRVFDMNSPEYPQPCSTLTGHDNAVTSLSLVTLVSASSGAASRTFLLSGSWDGTAKLWDIAKATCLTTMPGHENTVCVQGLIPSSCSITKPTSSSNDSCFYGSFATGSAGVAYGNTIADMKIRLWDIVAETKNSSIQVTATLRATVADHLGPIRGVCCALSTFAK